MRIKLSNKTKRFFIKLIRVVRDFSERLIHALKSFFKKNLNLKILSVIIAIILWIAVINQKGLVATRQISNIAVNITNMDLLSEKDLVLLSEKEPRITLKVSGTSDSLKAMDTSAITASIDLSSVTTPGEHSLPVTFTGVDKNVSILQDVFVDVNVDKLITVTLPIGLNQSGELASGLTLYSYEVKPSAGVTITGPKTVVSAITSAKATVELNSLADSDILSLPIKLYNSKNAEVVTDDIELSDDLCTVTLTVFQTKTLEVAANTGIVAEAASGYVVTGIELIPSELTVCGEAETIANLTQLTLPAVVEKALTKDTLVDVDVPLPEGIYLANSFETSGKIQVLISVDKMVQVEVDASADKISVNNPPADYKYNIETTEIVFVLHISPLLGKELTAADLSLSIDMADCKAAGSYDLALNYTLPAGVELVSVSAAKIKVLVTGLTA